MGSSAGTPLKNIPVVYLNIYTDTIWGGGGLHAVEAGPRRMRLLRYLLVAVLAIGLVSARPQAEDTEEEEEEDEGVDEAEYDYDLVGAGGGKHFFNATIRLSLDIICSISNNAWPRVQLVNLSVNT